MHPHLQLGEWEGGVKNFRKVFAGGRGVRIFVLVGGGLNCWRSWWGGGAYIVGVGRGKLHNTSIKTIFGITNLIYFRDIWKMHLLSSDKISFSMAIWSKCLEHSVVFPVNLFWSNLHLIFPPLPFSWNSQVWSFFSSILGIETFSWESF